MQKGWPETSTARQGQTRPLQNFAQQAQNLGVVSQTEYPSWPFTNVPSFSLDILNGQPVGFKVFASLDFTQEVCLASDLKRISPPTWTPPTVLSSRPEFL